MIQGFVLAAGSYDVCVAVKLLSEALSQENCMRICDALEVAQEDFVLSSLFPDERLRPWTSRADPSHGI